MNRWEYLWSVQQTLIVVMWQKIFAVCSCRLCPEFFDLCLMVSPAKGSSK
jgi:hypothetical protein